MLTQGYLHCTWPLAHPQLFQQSCPTLKPPSEKEETGFPPVKPSGLPLKPELQGEYEVSGDSMFSLLWRLGA